MGGIRRHRKKIVTPGHPYDSERLINELVFVGEYGLRNKRELWKARTILSTARAQARRLLAQPADIREQREKELLSRLTRLGLLPPGADLDTVLALDVRSVLNRRLQTIVFNKGLARSPYQARQFVVHRHIALNGRVVTSPGRLITVEEEDLISYAPRSPLNKDDHPARPQATPAFEEKGKTKPGRSKDNIKNNDESAGPENAEEVETLEKIEG
ncbi:MAG: 30S ribosomal protein S4 [Candidatus Heimdallarchaeaceae archaeon]